MKNGYDQFFKTAKGVSRGETGNPRDSRGNRNPNFNNNSNPNPFIKPHSQNKGKGPAKGPGAPKKRASIPWKLVGFSFVGVIAAIVLLIYADGVETWISRLEISWSPLASAADSEKKDSKEKQPESSAAKSEKNSADKSKVGNSSAEEVASEKKPNEKNETGMESETGDTKDLAKDSEKEDEFDHLARLSERKLELDAREEELARQEVALKKQREEIEKRMLDLEKVRRNISSVLEDRVKVDEAKVESLVQTISNMKPPQAAKMIEDLDESLAVEIVGRMKKKNAAEILNLIKVEKGRSLVEKYAGYKRK